MGERDSGVEPSYFGEAFRWPYNWILLTAALLFALVSRSALPLLLTAGLELMYLSVVPNLPPFRRLVRVRRLKRERQRQSLRLNGMLQELPEPMRARYFDMRKLCQTVRDNYRHLSSTSQILVRQTDERLRGLLQGYLRLLHGAYKHREHLRTAAPDAIRRDIADVERKLPSEAPKVQEINRKRVVIMTKRLEKFENMRENCEVIDAQCAAIEDVLKLIRDQSVTLRDPQQISDQLESLVRDVEHTEEIVRQVEAVFELGAPDLLHELPPLGTSAPEAQRAPARSRVRS
jgi:hypothetical protein